MPINLVSVPASITAGGTYTINFTGGGSAQGVVELDFFSNPRIVPTINTWSDTQASITMPSPLNLLYDEDLGYPWYISHASDGSSDNSSLDSSLHSKVMLPVGKSEIGLFEPVIAPGYIGYYAADTSKIRSGVQAVYGMRTAPTAGIPDGLPVRIYADGEVEINFAEVDGVESVQTFEFFFVDRDGVSGNTETFTFTPLENETLPPMPVLPADIALEIESGETLVTEITLLDGTASSAQLTGKDAALFNATVVSPTKIRIEKKTPFDHANPQDL